MSKVPEKAMVFAAGLGTRMRPLTDTTPKPMVNIGGKPMVDTILDALAAAGVKQAIVNVHHLAKQIEDHLAHRIYPQVIISDERTRLLDQGGGIKKVLPLLGQSPFYICNTDAIWLEGPRSNIVRLAEMWDTDQMDILLLVASTANSVGIDWPGDFSMDQDGRLKKRREGEVVPFVYSGIGIIKPELFDTIEGDSFRLAPLFFSAAEQGRLFGLRLDGIWLHVGTMTAITEAEQAILRSAL
jgi:N-acetyl-alpha-D-muramate 1-phosphate uridylyltransferase